MKSIFFFDCDETLWHSKNNDYISRGDSDFKILSKNSLVRKKDGAIFTLRKDVVKVFENLKEKGNMIGIVSDNKKMPVVQALSLFGLIQYINLKAINVKLWKGYCPKHKMILDVLKKPKFGNIFKTDVYWLDDKNYSREAREIGVNFIQVNKKTNLFDQVKSLLI